VNRYLLTDLAFSDLREIRDRVAQDSKRAAIDLLEELQRAMRLLAEMPGVGREGPPRVRLYGWGIRLTPSGWMFNVSGLDAVELTLRSGKRFRIGTDDPRDVIQALEKARGSSRG
jgi:plasmid stabilization system protein ParE